MITIFNRKEILITYDMKEQARVREILEANNIDYIVKVLNPMSPSPMSAGSRRMVGSLGVNQSISL